jgi:hypothetical protein
MADQGLVHGIHHKLLIKLMGYNYRIEYKKGREKKAVDALSRRPPTESLRAISTTIPLWVKDVQNSYIGEPKCKELEEQLHVNPDSVPNFTLTSGLIRYKGRLYIGTSTDLKTNMIQSFHSSALGGHSGDRVNYIKLIPLAWNESISYNIRQELPHLLEKQE